MANSDFKPFSVVCNCQHRVPKEESAYQDSDDSMDIDNLIPFISHNEAKSLFEPYKLPNTKFNFIKNAKDKDDIHQVERLTHRDQFFVEPETKLIKLLQTLPNSYLPLIPKREINIKHRTSRLTLSRAARVSSVVSIHPPSYLDKGEVEEYCEAFPVMSHSYIDTKQGLGYEYDPLLTYNSDLNSFFIHNQRLFYELICNQRLVTSSTAHSSQGFNIFNQDLHIPIKCFEPRSLIRRLMDYFIFWEPCMPMLYNMCEDETQFLQKLNLLISTGFHRVLASPGIPLPPLLGETCEMKKNDLYVYAECKKSESPVKIVYNLRWKKHMVKLDGSMSFEYSYKESLDEFQIRTQGVNTIRFLLDYVNQKPKFKYYSFNLPLKYSFRGCVDKIKDAGEVRAGSVDSFVYVRGDKHSSIVVYNYLKNKDLFFSFYSLVTKVIVNFKEKLENGHSFIGFIIHNSGISFEGMPESEHHIEFMFNKLDKAKRNIILNAQHKEEDFSKKTMSIKKSMMQFMGESVSPLKLLQKPDKTAEKILEEEGCLVKESSGSAKPQNTNQVMQPKSPKFADSKSKKDIAENSQQNLDESACRLKHDSTVLQRDEALEKVESLNDMSEFQDGSDQEADSKSNQIKLKGDDISLGIDYKKEKKKEESDDQDIRVQDDPNANRSVYSSKNTESILQTQDKSFQRHEEQMLNRIKEEEEKAAEESKYTFKKSELFNKRFQRLVNYMYHLIKDNDLIVCFSTNFIYKLLFGSYVTLNFYNVNFSLNEVQPIYLIFNTKYIDIKPLSQYYHKKGFMMKDEENDFLMTHKDVYNQGKYWDPLYSAYPTDTRFREDFLWYLRYCQACLKSFPSEEENIRNEDFKKTAWMNAEKWRERLEGYLSLYKNELKQMYRTNAADE